MISPDYPNNEEDRLKALGSYHLLDSTEEEDFDNITYLASIICQTPISLITFIDDDRQYFKSHLGLTIYEASREVSFCAHAINQPQTLFEITDARLDNRFHDNPLVTGKPDIVFYAGIPLVTNDGFALGTLCVIDNKPRILSVEQKEALTKLAKQVILILEARRKKIFEKELNLFDFTFRNSSMPTYYIQKDASFYDFNDAGCKQLGYVREELKALKVFNIFSYYDENKYSFFWEELKEKRQLNFETQQKRKDGTFLDLNVICNFVKYGDIELNCSYVVDITEKKQQESQMRYLGHAYKNTDSALFFLKEDGSFLDFNFATANLLGYSYEEFLGKTIMDVNPIVTKDYWEKRWLELKVSPNQTVITKFQKKDGTLIDVEVNTNSFELGGVLINFGYYRNITEKLKVETNLKLTTYTIANAAWGIVYFKEDGSIYNCNLAYANMYGYDSIEEASSKTIFDYATDFTTQIWKKYWEELKLVKRLRYNGKRTKNDGTIIDVEIIHNYVKFGDLELNCAFLHDISDKLELEKILKIVDFSFRNASIAMHFWRKDGSLYNFNEASCILFGYTKEEFKNITIFDLSSQLTLEIWKKWFVDFKKETNETIIRPLKRKDNSLIYVEIRSEIIIFEDMELCFSSLIDVTEKLNVIEDLKQSNQRYEYATLATTDVIWEANIIRKEVFISKNFTTIYGHPVDDGWMPMENNIWRQNIHPDEVEEVLKSQSSVLSSDNITNHWRGEYQLRRSDGSYAKVYDRVFGIKDEEGNVVKMVGAIQDITKRKEEEERLKLMEAIILNAKDSVLITEAEPTHGTGPKILFVNPAFEKMTGFAKEEVIGKTPRILQNEDTDRKELDRLGIAMKNWESCEITVSNSRKNGEKFWINLEIIPIADQKGWFTHWIAVERDVTKQIEAAQEKEKLLAELIENNLELKQFSYITSHNLRAPLTNLVAICNLIKTDKITDALTLKLIEGFKISTRRLNETLNDLIEILIIKENRNLQTVQLTFDDILKKVNEVLSISFLETRVVVHADFSEAPTVTFTHAYLESIFINLFTNAIKYHHPERVSIITIKTYKEINGDTKLIFNDNGIGIDMVYAKDKIFGLYKKFHKNADSKGIGLYLIYSQITALGGTIEVESEVNIGTTFKITFK